MAIHPVNRLSYIRVVDLEITASYEISGYEFVAELENHNGRNFIKSTEEIPVKYLTRCQCDHCQANRQRVHTILLKKDNEYIQVGKSCVKDYLGVNISDYTTYIENLYDCSISYSDDIIKGVPTLNYYSVDSIIEQTLIYTKKYGFISVKTANEKGITPTCNYIYDILRCCKLENISNDIKLERDLVKSYIKSLNGYTNQYYNNLQIVLDDGYADRATFNTVVSMVGLYSARVNQNDKSKFIGKIGDKVEFTSKIKTISSYNTLYGKNYVYQFTDNDNIYIWKTATDLSYSISSCLNYTIKGTIKEHKEYNGQKQTILTHCKIESV